MRNKEIMLSGIFCSSLIISNVLAFKTFNFMGITLPAAVIMFPVVYIVNDIMAEVLEYNKSRATILVGFMMNFIAVIAYTIAIKLPPSEFFNEQGAFETVLGTSFRILIASMMAYIVGSMTNLKIMDKLRKKHGNDRVAQRCLISTIAGEFLDASIFISIAFIGNMGVLDIIMMIINQASIKIIYEVVAFPITIKAIRKLK